MSQLPPNVKDAIVDAAGDAIPGGMPGGRWTGLSGAVRTLIYAKVAERLMQVDNGTVSAALLDALADGRLEEGEIKGALLAAAAELAGDSEAAALLHEALTAGPLNRETAIRVVVAWGQSRIEDETLRSLFTGLTGIVSSGSGQEAAGDILGRVLRDSGIDPALAARVLGAVRDRRLDASEIVLLLTTLAASAGGSASLAIGGDPLARAEALLQAGLPKGTETFLRKILEEDWLGVLSALLGTLELGVGGFLLRQLARGQLREKAVSKLTGLLEMAGLDQAGTVANAIIDIATGARSLFAEGEESGSGLRKAKEIALWREIRQVLFLARLATFAGPVVSGGAQDRPHIFAAAAIRFDSPLHDMLPENADVEAKKRFCKTVTEFLDEHFGPRMRRRFRDEPVLAITLTDLRPNGSTGEVVFIKVRRRLAA